jgi:FkbM family methyltransferase
MDTKIVLILIIILVIYYLYINIFSALIFSYFHNIQYSGIYSYIYIYNEIFINGDYSHIVPNKDNYVIFDIGANIGLYSLYINENYKNVNIHCFEPITDLFNKLKHNLEYNKKNNNKMFINNVGLGDTPMTTTINFYPDADGLSTINNDMKDKKQIIIESSCKNSIFGGLCNNFYENILNTGLNNVKVQEINIIKLSEYITKNNITNIDLIKIDVEGFEFNVLNGINDDHFKIINNFIIEIENYNNTNLINIEKKLVDNNFKINNLSPNGLWTIIIATRN